MVKTTVALASLIISNALVLGAPAPMLQPRSAGKIKSFFGIGKSKPPKGEAAITGYGDPYRQVPGGSWTDGHRKDFPKVKVDTSSGGQQPAPSGGKGKGRDTNTKRGGKKDTKGKGKALPPISEGSEGLE